VNPCCCENATLPRNRNHSIRALPRQRTIAWMGVPLWKRALVVALLAYNWAGLLTALRARGNAFLAPPGVGPPQLSARDDALKPADGGSPRLQFTADLHASSVMSSIDLLVRRSPARIHLFTCSH
jgi:hypothetical protein